MQTIVKKILELKEERNAVILAHNYQAPRVQEVADITGDSLGLAKAATKVEEDVILFCGVKFMGETAKILNPEKKVLMPVVAGCPLASTATASQVRKAKQKHPGAAVVSYVNTTASVKAVSDACCTSTNAVSVVESLPHKKIILVPDNNLARHVQKQVPEKQIIGWDGYCPYHNNARKREFSSKLWAHPECRASVQDSADQVLSTGGMLRQARRTKEKKIVIGTETGLIYRLRKENPGKDFEPLSEALVCEEMKMTRLKHVLNALENEEHEIKVSEKIARKARKALKKMVEH